MRRIILRITTVCAGHCLLIALLSAQSMVLPLDHTLNIRLSKQLYCDSTRAHTSFQPYILSSFGSHLDYDSLLSDGLSNPSANPSWLERKIFSEHLLDVKTQDYHLYFDFLPDIGAGYELQNHRSTNLDTRGIELGGTIGDNFAFRTSYSESVTKFPSYLDQFMQQTYIVPGQGYIKPYSQNEYDYVTGSISYSPSKYLNIQLGQDKNFIGDGYRSLLLSDVAFTYPFLKLTTQVWDLQYTIMWTQFQIPSPGGISDSTFWPKTYGAFHYLDWCLSDRFTIGFFESVMWKAQDTVNGYRGFDLNYLNPLIFFVPVQYSMGSPDKMHIGINLKYKVSDNVISYAQLYIDEMTIGEYFNNRGYWADKNAIQLGCKAFDALDVKNLYVQTEFNTATPYAYSHNDPATSYSHYEQSLADPLGANFYEGIFIGNYTMNRWMLSTQFNYAIYGADSGGLNYGGDIFKSYDTRVSDYGNYTTQGVKTHLWYLDCRVAYMLNPLLNLRVELGVTYRRLASDLVHQESTWIQLGIRGSFKNLYYDF